MATREKAIDRGARRAAAIRILLGRELHEGRVDRGLSLADAGVAVRLSASTVSRIERGLAPNVSVASLAKLLEVVGLELSARAYPGAGPIRDAPHVRLLAAFQGRLHRSIRWATEVPLPNAGDLRAWDAMVSMPAWRYGVEAETAPHDAQALERRMGLKIRDGHVSGIPLVLPDTRRTRVFLGAAADHIAPLFPVPGRRAMELLGAGVDPGGSAIVVVDVPAPPRRRARC